ncbi:MAG TPA: MdtA/MuxA family multidrug efflux RND transporter periplasmic adaptor subunit [Nitrospiria bacterium]|nr:MdtA/MuxA family multidrug efflux RND transporter periplasmic adaptor subunit [Nitrospiria bacterium]
MPFTQEMKDNPVSKRTRSAAFLRRWWAWLVIICLLLAGGGVFTLMRPGDAQTPPQRSSGHRNGFDASQATPVVAASAKTGDIGVYLSGLGSVTPIATVTIRSRVDGQLMDVLFREGQIVRAGELLATIDPRPYQAQLAQAEGEMDRDRALLNNAKIDLDRYRALYQKDLVPQQQLDTQEALVQQYEGTLKIDQAAIDTAKLQLVYCRITAPVGGRLGLRQVDPGNIVHASDQNGLIVITQLQPITVVFAIPEDSIHGVMSKLRAGEKLPVEAYDRAGNTKLATGALLTVDNQIDPATGTVKLKAQFSNDDSGLFPNQFVNVQMLLDTRRGATLIPTAAVQQGAQGTFVYVVKADRTVAVRPIKLGPTQGERAAVETGLAPGELVVVDGTGKLREGAKVELAAQDAPPADHAAAKHNGGRHRVGDPSSVATE